MAWAPGAGGHRGRPVRWLAAHATSPTLAGPVNRRVLWLTGQSSWSHSRLSPRQLAVLDAVAGSGWEPLRIGFPWTERAAARPYRPEPLPVASARNAAQYFAVRTSPAFRQQIARHLQTVLDRTSEHLLLLCGSTGSLMAHAALPLLTLGPQVTAVALGPVGERPTGGGWDVHVIQGRQDRVSRWGYRGSVDHLIDGRHLDATTSPAAIEIILRIAQAAR